MNEHEIRQGMMRMREGHIRPGSPEARRITREAVKRNPAMAIRELREVPGDELVHALIDNGFGPAIAATLMKAAEKPGSRKGKEMQAVAEALLIAAMFRNARKDAEAAMKASLEPEDPFLNEVRPDLPDRPAMAA